MLKSYKRETVRQGWPDEDEGKGEGDRAKAKDDLRGIQVDSSRVARLSRGEHVHQGPLPQVPRRELDGYVWLSELQLPLIEHSYVSRL